MGFLVRHWRGHGCAASSCRIMSRPVRRSSYAAVSLAAARLPGGDSGTAYMQQQVIHLVAISCSKSYPEDILAGQQTARDCNTVTI